ncbi:DUF1801 domain-containing protein [Proteiniclasticum sp. QWL-01]|uniref:iron chaperone n=1 Tax=Proteiniclasticum sp. QWL-01 TaxID=3036945 RepID=UPI0024115CB8|nr:DUF1801 domain-containing protein [Proteiniclasticum sp. QWL-01]WFF74192.1 DUF1801 domain-containing protein [Proteiniclasticum sp. QWL-01]
MQPKETYSQDVNAYLAAMPPAVRDRLEAIRAQIHELVPEVTEKIAYGIPTFQWRGKNMCHIGGSRQHIGFYPGPQVILDHAQALSAYKTSKGAIQFPHEEPIPPELIRTLTLSAREQLEKILK